MEEQGIAVKEHCLGCGIELTVDFLPDEVEEGYRAYRGKEKVIICSGCGMKQKLRLSAMLLIA